ncbi:MAG: hypothetical protein R3C19_07270 [Planctomycetaceae bacterium]
MIFTSRLMPMDVAARVVKSPVTVPLLSDEPFAASGTLESGIHVHWALPDALTRPKANSSHPPRFHGVPDLWLVVRFNPVSGNKRTYRAWVVDSFAETVTPLADWIPPESRDEALIHTAPGLIRRVGRGWGEWDNNQPFDALTTAYYPACRTRLGFHDDLSDLVGVRTGTVSYTVIGWYSRSSFDPFYNDGLRRKDRMGHRADLRINKVVTTPVSIATERTDLDWNVEVRTRRAERISKGEAIALNTAAAVREAAFRQRSESLKDLVAALPVSPDSPQHAVVDSLMPDSVRTHTICHGSVMDVPLRPFRMIELGSLAGDSVFLYPNVQRAMAEVASRTADEQKTDWLDMMLGNLGQQSGSTSGVVDLAGAQHARTFQSVPGKTRFYARLDIYPPLIDKTKFIGIKDLFDDAPMVYSGHWPEFAARSAAVNALMMPQVISPGSLNQPPAQPAGPTTDEIIAWIEELRTAFAAARQQSAAAGKPLDERLIRIHDHRRNAQPTPQGRSADGLGPDQAGWWIDLGDENAPIDIENNPHHKELAELRRSVGGARLHMPDAENIFEVPGPRWYRPWAPHLVIFGTKRSYRHGFDGRFRADGHLTTRVSGESMIGMKVGSATVMAKDLIGTTADFSAAGLPAAASELIQEHLLSDAENAPIMARNARLNPRANRATTEQMAAASRAIWLSRGNLLKPEERSAVDLVAPVGTPSSAAGLQAWRDWYGPLFLDTRYTHRRKRFNDAWQLPPEFVETIDQTPVVPPDRQQEITERQIATVSIAKVLKKTLVTELTIDPYGKPIKKKSPPDGVNAQTFDEMDIVSASLSKLDYALFADGERERGGFVHMNQVRVFDTFGTPADWSSNNDNLNPPPQWATALPARLSCWGRLNFRLQSASDPATDAAPLTPPVCGILLPDFVDQSLEVYDSDGNAIGQLRADDPIRNNSATATTLSVTFELLPWVAATLPPGSDPALAINNPTLRRFVQSLLAQSVDVPANAAGWHETGFTAMLRVFDTVRSTLDPAFRASDSRVRLLGEPILVMNTRLLFEASNQTAAELKSTPQAIAEPPSLPTLRVRIGDVTRPDDGVLGCFLPGDTFENDRFAPVSREAAEQAVLNQMVFGASQTIEPVTHPFIDDQVAEFDVPANTPLDLVVLTDARGSLYATCGVLPRKAIVVPKDFLEPSLKKLEPTFQVGPVLSFEVQDTLVPVVPAPTVEGMDTEFVHDDEEAYPELPLPPAPPTAELPASRVRLTEGWVRMSRQEP